MGLPVVARRLKQLREAAGLSQQALATRAGLSISGRALIARFAALSVLVLIFQDGSSLRRLAGLSPPLGDILQMLSLPPAERYLTTHA